MVVLSLFDGISCGKQALLKANISMSKYYASEIEEGAIEISKRQNTGIERLGDVRNIKVNNLNKIDLLIGGSPCQNFLFSGKRNGASTKCKVEILSLEQYLKLKEEGFEFSDQSYLFWEYMRVLTELRKINPKIKFLLENVVMLKKWEKVISEALGVEPIEINSALVSAQNRRRLYWTNISDKIDQPKDKNIKIEDILEEPYDGKVFCGASRGRYIDKRNKKTKQFMEIRRDSKTNTLTTVLKDNYLVFDTDLKGRQNMELFTKDEKNLIKIKYRSLSILEYERLQALPDNYTYFPTSECQKKISKQNRYKAIGKAWNIDIIVHILNYLKKP
jgi:site-specific DNA-cytosine methylase